MGAYLNKANVQESGLQQSFREDNNPHLYISKQVWDPRGIQIHLPEGLSSEYLDDAELCVRR